MLTFREIYDRGEYPYALVLFSNNREIVSVIFSRYDIASAYRAFEKEWLESDAFVEPQKDYGKYWCEVYATLDGLAERLEEILREKFEENTFQCSIRCIRQGLKTIYRTKKTEKI